MTSNFCNLFFLNQLPDLTVQLYEQGNNEAAIFERFNQLPIELRLKIWELSTRRGRLIRVYVVKERHIIVGTKEPSPAIFRVCQESRNEAIKIYNTVTPSVQNIPIYYHPELDILLLRTVAYDVFSYAHYPPLTDRLIQELGCIKHVALTFNELQVNLNFWFTLAHTKDQDPSRNNTADVLYLTPFHLKNFNGLKTLKILRKWKDRHNPNFSQNVVSYLEIMAPRAFKKGTIKEIPDFQFSFVFMGELRADVAAGAL